jgi:hypothetical protein
MRFRVTTARLSNLRAGIELYASVVGCAPRQNHHEEKRAGHSFPDVASAVR